MRTGGDHDPACRRPVCGRDESVPCGVQHRREAGAVAAGLVVDSRGRRSDMAIATYMFLLGGLLQTFAKNILFITVARWSAGGMFASSVALVMCLLGYFNKLASLFFVKGRSHTHTAGR